MAAAYAYIIAPRGVHQQQSPKEGVACYVFTFIQSLHTYVALSCLCLRLCLSVARVPVPAFALLVCRP